MAVVMSVVIWVGITLKGLVPCKPQALAGRFSLLWHTWAGLECGL